MGRKKKQETENKAIANELSTASAASSSPLAELKAKVESILFCIPEGVTVELLAHKVNMGTTDTIKWALSELQKDYELKAGGLKIISDDKEVWKFKVPDEHIPIVQEAAVPEFDKAVLETLAYIAWRNGSRQCDVVRVRGNKAYNHIRLLKEKEFIESHKSGLSKWLEPTKKFFEYFHLKQGEKLPIPEDVVKAAEEAEKAAAAIKLQEEEQRAQQLRAVEDLKKPAAEPEKSEYDEESDENSEEEPTPDEDITPEEEPEEDITPDEEPGEGGEEEPEGNPDNE